MDSRSRFRDAPSLLQCAVSLQKQRNKLLHNTSSVRFLLLAPAAELHTQTWAFLCKIFGVMTPSVVIEQQKAGSLRLFLLAVARLLLASLSRLLFSTALLTSLRVESSRVDAAAAAALALDNPAACDILAQNDIELQKLAATVHFIRQLSGSC